MIVPVIYKIQSKVKPERIYIGSAIYYKNRWADHKRQLRLKTHHNPKLQHHADKYGIDDLIFSIIEPCLPQFLIEREQYYINTLQPYFNVCKIAGSTLGRKMTEETKQKIIKANRGKIIPEEVRRKMSIANKGRIQSEEWKKRRGLSIKGDKHPNFGRKMPEKTRQAIIKANKGRKIVGQALINRSLCRIGKSHKMPKRGPMLDEIKKKISEARKGTPAHNKGIPMSQEQKTKLVLAWKIRRVRQKDKN